VIDAATGGLCEVRCVQANLTSNEFGPREIRRRVMTVVGAPQRVRSQARQSSA
jgi:hypothetical protein